MDLSKASFFRKMVAAKVGCECYTSLIALLAGLNAIRWCEFDECIASRKDKSSSVKDSFKFQNSFV